MLANLDCIWWVVSPQNPLKDPNETEDFAERLALARVVACHPRMFVTDLEKRLGTGFTAGNFAPPPAAARPRLLRLDHGADSFSGLHLWNRWRDIPDCLPLLVLDRPGSTLRALSSPAARSSPPGGESTTAMLPRLPAFARPPGYSCRCRSAGKAHLQSASGRVIRPPQGKGLDCCCRLVRFVFDEATHPKQPLQQAELPRTLPSVPTAAAAAWPAVVQKDDPPEIISQA